MFVVKLEGRMVSARSPFRIHKRTTTTPCAVLCFLGCVAVNSWATTLHPCLAHSTSGWLSMYTAYTQTFSRSDVT